MMNTSKTIIVLTTNLLVDIINKIYNGPFSR